MPTIPRRTREWPRGLINLLLALVLPVCTAGAQTLVWPERPVRVMVPYAAGSTPDAIARLIFERVQKDLGRPFLIENRAGAAGMIATDVVAKARPDGHTLVLAPAGPLATNVLLYRKMPYEPTRDLAPVALVAETPSIWVASPRIPENTAAELLKALADPRRTLAYASPGAGTLGHLSLAYLVALAEARDVPHVPYPGSPQIVAALAAGDVQMAALPPLAVAPLIKAGRIKAIATIGQRRNATLPDLPTLRESGIDFAPVGWFGIATTAGTPPPVVAALHRAIAQALADAGLQAAYAAQGLEVADRGPDAFGAYIREEIDRWRPVVQRFGITLD